MRLLSPDSLLTPQSHRLILCFAALTLAALASNTGLVQAQAGPWTIQTADPGTGAGNTSSLRLDPVRGPRVAEWMTGTGIRYAEFNNSVWSVETVPLASPNSPLARPANGRGSASLGDHAGLDPANALLLVTTATSLALDSQGDPWIAWVTTDQHNSVTTPNPVSVTHRSGGVWTTENLEPGVDRPVIDVDAAGRVHVLFEAGTVAVHDLRYAIRDGGIWTYETVNTRADRPALQLDGDGNPHILYADETTDLLMYAVRNGTSWDKVTVPTPDQPAGFALALDPAGQARVAVADYAVTYQTPIHYLEQQGASWQVSTADPSSSLKVDLSLALGPTGAPMISYNDQSGLDLKVATRTAGVWTSEVVDGEGNNGYSSSVAVNADGRAYISYHGDQGGMRVAIGTSTVGVGNSPAGRTLRLAGPWPNPGGVGVPLGLSIELPVATSVRLEAYDVSGRRISEREFESMSAGPHSVSWDPAFEAPGMYVLRAITGRGESVTRRVVVVR